MFNCMNFNLQPTLENESVRIRPVQPDDFEALFAAAADPLIWAQHPNPLRWQRDHFANYFRGAIESGGAFVVFDTQTGELIGSSRYHDVNLETKSVEIGYTFLVCSHWGGKFNPALKKLMIEHAFAEGLERVEFHIGANNRRSQIAMERIGGRKFAEHETTYFGEQPKLDFFYEIRQEDWVYG